MISVFVSSTGKDLADYREAACRAINGLDGFHADAMENWGARADAAERFDGQRVASADVVVLILGHCYGSSPPAQELSYTELEYEAALGSRSRFWPSSPTMTFRSSERGSRRTTGASGRKPFVIAC